MKNIATGDVLERIRRLAPSHVTAPFKTVAEWREWQLSEGQKRCEEINRQNRQLRVEKILNRSGIQPLHRKCSFSNYQVQNEGQRYALSQLGFDYWTPVGGAITPRERELLSGFVDYLCESVGREHTPALSEAAEQYLNTVATRRTRDTALLKSFEAFREWVTIQAGFYTEHFYPDGSHGRRAKSIAFANMDETEFQQVYKSVLNVLWNWILFRKFSSPEQVENVAAQLLEFA